MWHPKQLLHDKIIDALFMGGFSPLHIEFLGWLSYVAAALNNSRNPVKAAHTILANASNPDHNMSKMLATFVRRKEESIEPEEVESHDEADKVLDNLEWTIKKAITVGQMSAAGYEDYTKGGVSHGESSITSHKPEDDDEPYALVTGTEDSDE
jgi:hypothetical protein